MPSVTSLDDDLRRLRLEKYTPSVANDVKLWIETILGEELPEPDLLDALKNGVALCRLANLLLPKPGLRFKTSQTPFIQMENIALFLKACQTSPINLPQHDMFLTVDLFEKKDPAQVLQCIASFSRVAHSIDSKTFPTTLGPKPSRNSMLFSPQSTSSTPTQNRARGLSTTNTGSSSHSSSSDRLPISQRMTWTGGSNASSSAAVPSSQAYPIKGPGSPPPSTSTWSRRDQEGATQPAWNIAQYGYMGGASQGNLGVSFGVRRQITSAGPYIPNLAEKEKERSQKLQQQQEAVASQKAEEDQLRRQREEEEARHLEEERQQEEEARRVFELERRKTEEERLKWEEEERQWKLVEEKRKKEEAEALSRLEAERLRVHGQRNSILLHGQLLSEYQDQDPTSESSRPHSPEKAAYVSRIKELESQLEEARQREREYEMERKRKSGVPLPPPRTGPKPSRPVSRQDSWSTHDKETLHTVHKSTGTIGNSVLPKPAPPKKIDAATAETYTKPEVISHKSELIPDKPSISRYENTRAITPPDIHPTPVKVPISPRPLPIPPSPNPKTPISSGSLVPATTASATSPASASGCQPNVKTTPFSNRRPEARGSISLSGPKVAKSLLEREMELERQRQKEWEEAQMGSFL